MCQFHSPIYTWRANLNPSTIPIKSESIWIYLKLGKKNSSNMDEDHQVPLLKRGGASEAGERAKNISHWPPTTDDKEPPITRPKGLYEGEMGIRAWNGIDPVYSPHLLHMGQVCFFDVWECEHKWYIQNLWL